MLLQKNLRTTYSQLLYNPCICLIFNYLKPKYPPPKISRKVLDKYYNPYICKCMLFLPKNQRILRLFLQKIRILLFIGNGKHSAIG